MSFGFSVGDFLAGAKLIADLTRILSASRGATMEYQQLILDLQLIETTLIQIHQMSLASQLNTSAVNALAWIAQSTKATIADFIGRTKKYQESLSVKGSGNKVKDVWMKVGWSMYKPAEIRSLQQRLQLDLGSINCLISLAIRDKSSLGAYYDEIDAGSYAQSRRAYLPSYGDDDFGVIVHRRITQEFVVGRKMASFDPIYREHRDPSSFFRVGQAFAVLLPEQRVYESSSEELKPSKKTLYLSYQLQGPREGDKGKHFEAPMGHDARISAVLSQSDDGDDESNKLPGSQTTYESRVRNTYIGEAAIRRLVVVREGISSALCLPIQTYNGRGCIDQVGKKFFGIIYTSTNAPKPMDGEEEMTKKPIHLNPAHPADSLHESSRINYSKLYRVDYDLRVKDLGLVDVDSVHVLIQYFEESSIKLTADLKFNETQAPTKTDAEKAAGLAESKIPRITMDDYEGQGPVITQLESQQGRADNIDIVGPDQDQTTESLFDFEL